MQEEKKQEAPKKKSKSMLELAALAASTGDTFNPSKPYLQGTPPNPEP